MESTLKRLIIGPGAGMKLDFPGLAVHYKISGEMTSGQLAIVEHPMQPGWLVPPHIHHDEDELSYVLEGEFGVRIGDEIDIAGPGTYVYKPRGIPHTFWNAGPRPARLIELIFPAGFERFFAELAQAARTTTETQEMRARAEALSRKYGQTQVSEWIPELKARFNLKLLGE